MISRVVSHLSMYKRYGISDEEKLKIGTLTTYVLECIIIQID
jgi:hypothetical protein